MAEEKRTETTIAVQHVRVATGQSFERARERFESRLPALNTDALTLLHSGNPEGAAQMLAQAPALSIFLSRDHGELLKIAGLARKALQYDVGNSLTATKMTRHKLPAALYAPFRVLLYEDAQGQAIFEYDKPSSLFGQFDDDDVRAVAVGLDAAIEAVFQGVGE